MPISPVSLFLLALCVDLSLSCLGKTFMLTYPVKRAYMFTGWVTLYTYHEQVTVSRNDKMEIPGLFGRGPAITFISLTRLKKVHLQLQFNSSMYKEYEQMDHIVTLEGDGDFGVNFMLLGHEYSVATMTILPLEYHGAEYYPFFLSKNQIYMVLMDKHEHEYSSHSEVQITFYFSDRYMRTLHAPMELALFPYVCDNKEKYSPYQNSYASTAVGFPAIGTGGTLCVIVGNCNVEDKRNDTSANCTVVQRDDLIDMPLATQFAAKEFIAFKGIRNDPLRSYITVMGLVAYTHVKVYYKSLTPKAFMLKKGQTRSVYLSEPYQFITSTRAIQVYLLFTSSCKQNEFGGPSMTSLIPNALFHNRYIWSLPYYLKITQHNYLVAIKRHSKDYGFVYNGDKNVAHKWPWKIVYGTRKWTVCEIEIKDFPEVFTFTSSKNMAFGLYLYGVDIAISYLHFVDFLNAVTFRHNYFCYETRMIVGDLIDNDCDGFPDEESSINSDDDRDGRRGEDVRSPVPGLFLKNVNGPPPRRFKMQKSISGPKNPKDKEINMPYLDYGLWFSLLALIVVPVVIIVYRSIKKTNGIETDEKPDQNVEIELGTEVSQATVLETEAQPVSETDSRETVVN